jgi:hypothetical protein
VTGSYYYLEPAAQTARLAAILSSHTDSSGTIPASAIAGLTSDLAKLLDDTRRSGHEDGCQEAASEQ